MKVDHSSQVSLRISSSDYITSLILRAKPNAYLKQNNVSALSRCLPMRLLAKSLESSEIVTLDPLIFGKNSLLWLFFRVGGERKILRNHWKD